MAATNSRYKFVTVALPIPKRLHKGRSASVNRRAAVSEAKRPPASGSTLKYPLGLLESSIVDINIIVFQGGDDGRGYRNMYKTPGDRT
jgi:hypothetical protein